MIVLSNDENTKPTTFFEVVERARQYEFKALSKVITDMGVELRLLVALAEQNGEDTISSAKVREIVAKYEDMSIDVMRETINRLRAGHKEFNVSTKEK